MASQSSSSSLFPQGNKRTGFGIGFGKYSAQYTQAGQKDGFKPLQEDVERKEVVVTAELSPDVKFTEDATAYPDYIEADNSKRFPLKIIHSGSTAYRSMDVNRFTMDGRPSGKALSGNGSNTWCLVNIRDEHSGSITRSFGDPRRSFKREQAEKVGGDPRNVKIKYSGCTQRPCTIFEVILEDKFDKDEGRTVSKLVTFHYYANNFRKTNDDIGLEIVVGKQHLQQNDRSALVASSEVLKAMEKEDSVCVATLVLNDETPRITGIDRAELDDYTGQDSPWLFAKALLTAKRVEVITEIPSKSYSHMLDMAKWMRTVLFVCAHESMFWYYKLAARGTPITHPRFPFDAIEPPRWLVYQWLVTFRGDKQIAKEPVRWKDFPEIGHPVWPDAATYSFENRLAEARESKMEASLLQRLENESKCQTQGEFYSSPDAPQDYICDFYLKGRADRMKPKPGLRIRVSLTQDEKLIQLSGKTCEDVRSSGADYTAILKQHGKASHISIESEYLFNVTVEFPHDPTAANRATNAISMIELGATRKTAAGGIYLPSFALGAPEPDKYVPDWLEKKFANDSTMRKKFEDAIYSFNLNDSQRRYAFSLLDPSNGASLLFGPPGTGKTFTMMSVVSALAVCGFKIMCTATSNTAVNRMMEVFEKKKPDALGEYAGVRFAGALARSSTSRTVDNDGDVNMDNDGFPVIARNDLSNWADHQADFDMKSQVQNIMEMLALDAAQTSAMGQKDKAFAERKAKWIAGLAFETPNPFDYGLYPDTKTRAEAKTAEEANPDDLFAGETNEPRKPIFYVNLKNEALRKELDDLVKTYAEAAAEPGLETDDDDLSEEARYELEWARADYAQRMRDYKRDLAIWKTNMKKSEAAKNAQKEAAHYQQLINQLRTGKASKTKTKELRDDFCSLDEKFSRSFLRNVVSVVFVTNNTSAHEILNDFGAEILFSDEAGQTRPADAMTPMAANISTLKYVSLGGDPKQLKPTVTSNDCNESSKIVEHAIFTKYADSPWSGYEVYMLSTQYRMHKDIVKFVNENVYEGRLVTPETLDEETDVDRVVKQALNPLAVASLLDLSHRIIAIDVSDDRGNIVCKQPVGSTSYFNEAEATVTVGYADGFITEGIAQEDIMIVTNYDQQQKLIRALMKKHGGDKLRDVRILTTDQAQGQEADIVILSEVMNKPGEPNNVGFITAKHRLTVQLSRARRWMFVIGNFYGWTGALKSGRGRLSIDKDCELFKLFVKYCFSSRRRIIHFETAARAFRMEKVQYFDYGTQVKAIHPEPRKRNIPRLMGMSRQKRGGV